MLRVAIGRKRRIEIHDRLGNSARGFGRERGQSGDCQQSESVKMKITFYIKAIPEGASHGFYDSPILTVDFPFDWRGTDAEALEYARKTLKEQLGKTEAEF